MDSNKPLSFKDAFAIAHNQVVSTLPGDLKAQLKLLCDVGCETKPPVVMGGVSYPVTTPVEVLNFNASVRTEIERKSARAVGGWKKSAKIIKRHVVIAVRGDRARVHDAFYGGEAAYVWRSKVLLNGWDTRIEAYAPSPDTDGERRAALEQALWFVSAAQ